MTMRRNVRLLMFAAALAAVTGGCYPGALAGYAIAIDLSPTKAEIRPGDVLNFVATVTGTATTNAEWSVQEVGGGAIDATGRYVAPQTYGTYHVIARSAAGPWVSSIATIIVTASPSVMVSINPHTTSVLAGGMIAFSAIVTGTANSSANWRVQEGSTGGAITLAGVYTAPSAAGTYHVVATSQADSSKSDTATVTVTPPGPSIAVTVTPHTTSMLAGASLAFNATVTGTSNIAVSWQVQEGPTGGAITSAGVYTAPSAAGTYHVVATSQADSSKSDTATVTVTPGSPPGGLVISSPLTLDKTSVMAGQTLNGSVTYQNTSSSAITVNWVSIELRPPGATHAGGPFYSLSPLMTTAQAIPPGGSLTLTGSRAFTIADPAGTWESYPTYQDANLAWHDGPIVTFGFSQSAGIAVTVTPSAPSTTPGGTISFQASVTGTTTGQSTAVTWSVQETGGGTVSSAGVYTAPVTLGTYHVIATSQADSTKSDTATVTVTLAPPPGPAPACATIPLRTTGTVHYYCDCRAGASAGCVAGNDANSGLTPALAKQTAANAWSTFSTMPAGDTIAMCRGGAWGSTSGKLNNSNCPQNGGVESTYCDLRDYAPTWGLGANNPRPLFNVGNADGTLYWDTLGGGYRVWNLDLRGNNIGTVGGGGSNMMYLLGDVRNLDICNVRMEGLYLGINMQTPTTVATTVTIRSSQFFRFGFSAFYGGTPGMTFDSNYLENNGVLSTQQMHEYYSYGNDTGNGAGLAMVIKNNHSVTNTTSTYGKFCHGVRWVFHGNNWSTLFQNNLVEVDGGFADCYGTDVSSSAVIANDHNVRFSRNRITYTNNDAGFTAMRVANCDTCQTDNNIISLSSAGTAIECGNVSGSGTQSVNQTHYNNSIYLSGGGTGIIIPSGTGHQVRNNAIWSSNAGPCVSLIGTTESNDLCGINGTSLLSSWWVAATAGNFKPVNPGSLVGAAHQTYYSPTAIGTVSWSPTDNGILRAAPIDVGAFLH